jgi:hypothetical protein
VEDWAKIRRLHRAEQLPMKQITWVMGLQERGEAGLAAEGPPRYQRAPRLGGGAVEPHIRESLQAWPTMPATVIAKQIGWTRGADGAQRVGAGAPADVSAAKSGLADGICGWGGRPV